MSELVFRPMLAGDAVLLSMQPSQQFEFGIEHRAYTLEQGEAVAAAGPAWTAARGIRIVGIAGFNVLFPGHARLWAALSDEVGADHLACTRFARRAIASSAYHRLEAIVDAANTRAVAWAKLVGLAPAHTMRGYGAAAAPHILFERVRVQ